MQHYKKAALSLILCFVLSSCYYLDGVRVSKEDARYCPKINRSFLEIKERKNQLSLIYVTEPCNSDTGYVENPLTGEIEMMITSSQCSCKDYYELEIMNKK